MLTDCELYLLLKQISDCSESVSNNVQNHELLKALYSLKCKQCTHCNDDMESLARTIRNTLLEINEIQEKNRERRHKEVMALFENYLTENQQKVPGTSANVKTELARPQHYEQQQVKTNNEALALAIESSSNIDEETKILELPIPQDAKDKLIAMHKEVLALRHQNLEIQGTAKYLESTEATVCNLNADAETEENGLTTWKDAVQLTTTASETRKKYAAEEIKAPSHPIDKANDEASAEDVLAVACPRKEYRERRKKSAEGNYESLYSFIKKPCNTMQRTTNEVSNGTTINDRTKEEGLVKGRKKIEYSGKAGQISVGSRKWLNLDAEDTGRTEITRDEFMAMRNEMFAKQRKKMEDRERKYACK